jgi:hypothetical protein
MPYNPFPNEVSQPDNSLFSSNQFLFLLDDRALNTPIRTISPNTAHTPSQSTNLLFLLDTTSTFRAAIASGASRRHNTRSPSAFFLFPFLLFFYSSFLIVPEIGSEHFPSFNEFTFNPASLIHDDFRTAFT